MNIYKFQSPRHCTNCDAAPLVWNSPRVPVTPCSFEMDNIPLGPSEILRGGGRENEIETSLIIFVRKSHLTFKRRRVNVYEGTHFPTFRFLVSKSRHKYNFVHALHNLRDTTNFVNAESTHLFTFCTVHGTYIYGKLFTHPSTLASERGWFSSGTRS